MANERRWGRGQGEAGGHVREQLSAYIDYELGDTEREQVREHLRRCPACENELATLKATRQLLANLPPVMPPRSFLLTPDMVGGEQAGPLVRPRPWWAGGRLRLALTGMIALLVLLLAVETLGGGYGSGQNAPPAMSDQQRTSSASENTPSPAYEYGPTVTDLPMTPPAMTGGAAEPPSAPGPPPPTTAAALAATPPANAIVAGYTPTAQAGNALPDTPGASQTDQATVTASEKYAAPTASQPANVTPPADAYTLQRPSASNPPPSLLRLLEGALLLLLAVGLAGAGWWAGRRRRR